MDSADGPAWSDDSAARVTPRACAGRETSSELVSALETLVESRGELQEVWRELSMFRLRYKFAIDELTTKIDILREEFAETHDHSPIEHVRSRLKSPQSIVDKARKRGADGSLEQVAEAVQDIAGVRVVCPFVSDVYWIKKILTEQPDITVLEVEDYIAAPKPNGYRSLHLMVQIPVALSDRTEHIPVELQIRTIAMDFWASVEHQIYYKYDAAVPPSLLGELAEAADTAADLDSRMARLRGEIRGLRDG
ncbi:GTP pyrophosphokinase family protein [Gordonia caeni]|uniref:GTP pyrophosphokinase family protein n=1 Tax=Gordonia caeni TaxID=1007097 RepID=A0ABP7NWJ3_9ACTN